MELWFCFNIKMNLKDLSLSPLGCIHLPFLYLDNLELYYLAECLVLTKTYKPNPPTVIVKYVTLQ